MEIVKGTLEGVWLNEEKGKPARLKMMGEYYSTFKKESLEGFQLDDLVEIRYHMEKGKFKTIDNITHVRDIEIQEKPKNKNLFVIEARLSINRSIEEHKQQMNKILDELEEKSNGT